MGGDQVRELGVGGVGAGLEGVDPLQQPRQQARRVAADLVAAQRQVVEAVEEHRQPLGRAEHLEERVEAGGVGVLAQDPFPDRVPGPHPELSVGIVEERFDPGPQSLGAGVGRGDQQHPVGRRPLGRRRVDASRRASASLLPVPGSPSTSSGASACSIAPACAAVSSMSPKLAT